MGLFTRSAPVSGDHWLVVGLGNPGPGYAANRHNVGQMVVDLLAERMRGTFKRHRSNAMITEGRTTPQGPRFVLAKPLSFMNVSGTPVAALARFYKLPADRVIVVHDELDIPFDSVRLKIGGGPGGHNGIKSVAVNLGTPDFVRVRVGIGRPPGRQDAADFVLKDFSATERKALPVLLEEAADAVELVASSGLEVAQQRFHAPKD
jgi:PTH1 family peptidyl-tRNA hydrolase